MTKLLNKGPPVKPKKRRRRRRKGSLAHVGIQRSSLFSPEWKHLSGAAKIFYVHLKSRYNGSNNGEIKLSYRDMNGVKGCSNDRTIAAAIRELEKKGWITITSYGGLSRILNVYKLTFEYEGYASSELKP